MNAGRFSTWLAELYRAQSKETGIEVPCGDCTACCQSYQFIHIRPDEKKTLAAIPRQLLFPAPGLPTGHVLMGYDEQGYCPMLLDGQCSIYDQRPLTCRIYDCRIFPAAGLTPSDDKKGLISEQSERWQFEFSDNYDRDEYLAVQTAATFLCDNASRFPSDMLPKNMTQLAVLALKIYRLFLQDSNSQCDEEQRIQQIVAMIKQ